jgi:hypothetical protein
MKTKTLIMTVALTGALLASASVVKANAFLEVSSGATTSTTSATGATSSLELVGPIGNWINTEISTGDAADAPLEIDVSNQGSGKDVGTLTIIYSTGEYPAGGAWNLFSSSTSGSVTVSLTAWSGTSLYTGGPTTGMTSLATQTLHASALDVSGLLHSPLDFFTEIITVTPDGTGTVGASVDSTFGIPDGGTTMLMLGSVLAGLSGLRSKFGAKRA